MTFVRPLCENYVIKWTRQGMAKDLDQLNNFKVKIVLLCQLRKLFSKYGNVGLVSYKYGSVSKGYGTGIAGCNRVLFMFTKNTRFIRLLSLTANLGLVFLLL